MTLPPHDRGAERAVLAAVLLSGAAVLDDVAMLITPPDFYVPAHQETFGAMLALSARGDAVDGTTLRAELVKRDRLRAAGGDEGLAAITDDVPLVENVRAHAAIVRRLAIRRAVDVAAAYVRTLVHGEQTEEEFAASVDGAISAALSRGAIRAARPIAELAIEWVRETQKVGPPGLATGLRTLDRVTGGMRRGEMIVLAGRPGQGKSALASAILDGVAHSSGLASVLFSLEMSAHQWLTRQVAARSGVDGARLRDHTINAGEWDYVQSAVRDVARLPIMICDLPAMTLQQVRSETRRMRARGPLGLVAVDYLQLMRGGGGHRESREQQVAEISRGLKALAKEVDAPVLALSQLNRKIEDRAGKRRPQLSDLRESGAIEQDADVVIFVHREDPKADTAIVTVDKNRPGACGEVRLEWDARLTRFSDLDDNDARHWADDGDER